MLHLSPPYLQYGNVAVGSDYGDPLQFYYFPGFPRIARTEDGQPAIQLLVFRENLDELQDGDEEAVAFLSLDVDLAIPPAQIEEIRTKIQRERGLDEKPRLAPLPLRRGTVRFLLLDERTPEPGKEKDPLKSDFVLKIFGAASPSLYGDNRAIFQAMLSKKGAAALTGALSGFTPIGVVYELTFAAIQPAYRVKVRADWHKVYTHWSERDSIDSIFYEHEVLKAIDALVDERVIQVEDVIEGVDEEGMKADHDAVMTDVRRLILDTFFKATLDKEPPAGREIGTTISDTIRDIAAIPFSMFGKYTYQRKELTTDELRTIEMDWSVRRAVERTIYPQAHMSTLFQGEALTRDQIVKVVTGSDALWRTMALDVSADCGWDEDGVVSISVDVEYGDPAAGPPASWSFPLTKDAPRQRRRAWLDPVSRDRIRYRYEVVFSQGGVPGPALTQDSGWMEHKGTSLVIQPGTLYRMVEAEVVIAGTFPFDRFPAVHSFVRYRSADGAFTYAQDGVLLPDRRKLSLRVRAPAADPGAIEVRHAYHTADGRILDAGWMPLEGAVSIVSDPEPRQLAVRVIPVGDRKKIGNLFVDFEYEDGELFQTGNVAFDEATINKPQEWRCQVADPKKRRYRYRATIVYNATGNNELLQTGWIESEAPTLPVGEASLALLGVEVSLQGKAEGVERVKVHLAYDDDEGGVHEVKDVVLSSSGDAATWEVRLKDLEKQSYSWTAIWQMSDGFDRKLGPVSSTSRFLAIPGKPPA